MPSVPGPRDVLALLERSGDAVEQLLDAVPRVGRLLDQAGRLLDRADAVLGDVESLIDRIEGTRQGADALVARIDIPLERLVRLLDGLEPPVTALQPTLERLAETTDPREVDALVQLIDHLPLLVTQVERDLLPVLRTLETVAPDLHDLLDVSKELNEMLVKLPGMGRIKRRVDEEQAEDD